MTVVPISSRQREILEAMADHWELLRWRCRDGRQRWHLGDMEVDGRAVRGLLQRGLLAHGGDYVGGELVLTDAGRRAVQESPTAIPGAPESGRVALGATNTASGAPDASVDDQSDWPKVEMCSTCRCCSIGRMGTCVGGCEPNGDRREHDRLARAERDAVGDAEGQE